MKSLDIRKQDPTFNCDTIPLKPHCTVKTDCVNKVDKSPNQVYPTYTDIVRSKISSSTSKMVETSTCDKIVPVLVPVLQ